MKRFLMTAVVAASMTLGAQVANAASLALNGAAFQVLNDGDVGIFFAQHTINSSFTDSFKFSLASESNLVTFGFVPQGAFSDLNLKVFNTTTASYVVPESGVPLTTAYTFSGLQAGNDYQFEVSGLSTSALSTYAGSATVSAVPLPAALPLFGAGLGALGLMWRRRKVQAAA